MIVWLIKTGLSSVISACRRPSVPIPAPVAGGWKPAPRVGRDGRLTLCGKQPRLHYCCPIMVARTTKYYKRSKYAEIASNCVFVAGGSWNIRSRRLRHCSTSLASHSTRWFCLTFADTWASQCKEATLGVSPSLARAPVHSRRPNAIVVWLQFHFISTKDTSMMNSIRAFCK